MSSVPRGKWMFGSIVFLLSLSSILWWPVAAFAQGSPLSLAQIEKLVEIHSPDDLIAREVQSRGLNFTPTTKILDGLGQRGAGQATLAAIRERIPIGTLKIQAPLESQILLDGADKGVTDAQGLLVLSGVEAGAHRLSVRKPGYNPSEFDVTLTANEYKRVLVTLEWTGGYLSVKTKPPDATVDVFGVGEYKGEVSDLPCLPGTLNILITHEGMKTESRSIIVAAGQHASVEVDLTPSPEYIQSQIADAKLRLGHGDPQGAARIADSLIVLEPNNPDLESLLADAYGQMGDVPKFNTYGARAIADGGAILFYLVHEHLATGESIHPATLTVTAKTITYDPMGAACKYGHFTVPLTALLLAEVTNKARSGTFAVHHLTPGTFLLHLEIEKAGQRATLYFGMPDSQIVSQDNVNFLKSPGNSSQNLNAVLQFIQSIQASANHN